MKKRIVCLLLAVVSIISIFAFSASAENKTTVNAAWPGFRGGMDNLGTTAMKTPIDPSKVTLKWSAHLAKGMWGSISGQIIAEDALFAMSGSELVKLDLTTGKELARVKMAGGIGFGLSTLLYADGKIFCPLSGKIQAFDSKTLEPLWTFTDKIGGQANSPICYADGYVYTGYWVGEDRDANFVCVNATDGTLAWSKTQKGGYYWAGATVVGDAVIVGTDDGVAKINGTSHLFALNKKTGEVISDIVMEGAGDARSSIVYVKDKNSVYYVTKNGYLCKVTVDAVTGALSDFKYFDNKLQSTGTPVVYKDKVYYATGSGVGSSDPGYVCVANAETLELYYTVTLPAYPQCSLLLSTAYEKDTGKIYLYSTYNDYPGGINMVEVDPTKNTVDGAKVVELFVPEKSLQQYCICSLIAGPDGTLYYKNDSGNVLAVTNESAETVKTKINALGEITLKSENAISVARKAYDGLTTEEKATLEAELKVLVAAEESLKNLQTEAAQNVDSLIDAIGTVTLAERKKVDDAEAAYNKLSATNKELVTKYDVLKKALADLDALTAAEVEKLIENIGEVTLDKKDLIYSVEDAYDDLTASAQKLVKNIAVLEKALDDLDVLMEAHVQIVIQKIDAIGEVTLEKEALILEAQKAMDVLEGTWYKWDVTNRKVLKAAQTTLKTLQEEAAKNVDALIDALGEITLESEQAIAEARAAYDKLSESNKVLVTKLSVLDVAEDTLAALKKDAAEKAAAKDVDDKITALGEITLEKETAITEARAAYEALTADEKALVTKLDVLTAAETKLAELKAEAAEKAAAKNVDDKITALGEITLEKETAVTEARAAYEALTADEKAFVTKLNVLEAAEAKIVVLKKEAADKAAAKVVDDKITAIGKVTLESETALNEARAAYEALTAEQKAFVTKLNVLEEAEQAYRDLIAPPTGDARVTFLMVAVVLSTVAALALLRKKKAL